MEEIAMSKITIQDFAIRLAEKKNISVADAQRFMTAMLDTINEGLSNDKVVKIKGLGTFKVIDVKQRKSVDVNTGEEIIIEGRGKITFTPDTIMRDLVNKPFSQFETVLLNEGVDFSEMDAPSVEDEESAEPNETVEKEEPQEIIPQEEKIIPQEKETTPQEVEEKPQEEDEKHVEEEPDIVSGESFSEALLVLDYINGKELPKEEPQEEKEEPALDATDEAIADALFVLNTLDDDNTDVPITTETTVEPVEEVPAETQEEPLQTLMEPSSDEMTDDVPSNEEQSVEADTTEEIVEEEQPTAESEDDTYDEEENSSAWKRWLIAIALIGVVGLLSYYCINYFYNKEGLAQEEINGNNTVVDDNTPVANVVADSVAIADSLNRAIREKEIEDSIAALTLKEKQEKTEPQKIAQQNTQAEKQEPEKQQVPTQSNNKELEYAKRLVKYGAYNIVGTDQVITIKKGQTMTSVAKAYLGKDMACYIEVHNGTTTLIEGQKLKIPKLETKKKSKR